ncbi:hypothetical protein KC343_g1963 [Hortaea werneckii]|nr:hypothetical protein KC352_g7033 [Hortaea werneckii]KAI7293930.1 hypothetical protein KC340_g16333 [Hortaea werneckii]KAI7379124.1 hypothetical protein KC328_g13506 [Hortaea werneckii]KAI7570715.1 hypothetical protein KC317_g2237 [Hortaea werneckii]KAI7635231.1 hypothetical protein KC343_g1963 [Hortaea werneckii]
MESFRGEKGYCGGAYAVRLRLADSSGDERTTTSMFYAAEMSSDELLLGRPWRRQNGIVVDSSDDRWCYGPAGEAPAVRVRRARGFRRDMRKAEKVFAVSIKDTREGGQLPEELREFEDPFNSEEAAKHQRPAGAEHAVDLEEGQRPPHRHLYSMSERELTTLREYWDTALQNGWIRCSASEAGAPILFVPKKDGSLRLCVDYRGLNAITKKNRHPLPLISETLDRLGRAACYSSIDLKDAYHRIPVKKGDEWKTAFRTRHGHFEYMVMPFGLTNAPATFQSYFNRALAGLVDTSCVVYLDDILVYSDSHENHVRDLREVLARLRKFSLYARLKKCTFFTKEVEFLGYIVSTSGVSMDNRRVAAIEEWPRPMTLREVQVLLGFTNFYGRFIRNYSKIVAPLTSLSKGA